MGKRIAERRKELNLTQENIAEATNLSVQSISCIELGKKAIRPENLANLSKALNVTTDYLLCGERSEKQITGIVKKIALLSAEDYKIICEMAERLSNK